MSSNRAEDFKIFTFRNSKLIHINIDRCQKKRGGGEKEQYYESFAFLSYTSTLTLFDCLGWSMSQI